MIMQLGCYKDFSAIKDNEDLLTGSIDYMP